ncbi:MAG: hypothetical protein ACI9TH_004689 [Kiritimatiellia bacterium]|jgi:hypothetical protein
MTKKWNLLRAIACWSVLSASSVQALIISFQASDFGLNPTFSNVQTFEFSIDLAGTLTPGTTYNNPTLNGVDYHVFGTLTTTPSGFPAFNLLRSIGGAEFYTQGSSLSFTISPTADLSDGLQVSDFSGTDPVFTFNGREVGTGRYHPALFQLNADGTGIIQNSNNIGGVNPSSGMVVDVDFGEEYITELSFNPATLTLAGPVAVPEPSTLVSLLILGACLVRHRRR